MSGDEEEGKMRGFWSGEEMEDEVEEMEGRWRKKRTRNK